MQRVLVYSHEDRPLFELSPSEVYGLTRRETINGEHALSIRTSRALEKGYRILTQDDRGRWREHVVYGTTHTHEGSEGPVGEYYCVWSLEPDLMGTHVSAMPGVQSAVLARVALEAALGGTSRWVVGTVTNVNLGGASMYDMGGWDAMQVLTKTWGGEIDTTINVSSTGVVSRRVDYYDMQGEQVAKRRFDFGADLRSVRRKMPDGPLFCRISPRGKGEETEGGGYGRKITIESVNDGKDWLENPSMVSIARLPDGNGGYEYPTLMVEKSDMETPQDLKDWALSVLEDYTVPKVTYEVDAVQAGVEGVSVQGVSLGDVVHVVDRKLDDLRVSARVVTIETDMLDELSTKVTLGYVSEPLSSIFAAIQGGMDKIGADVSGVRGIAYSTAQYLDHIIDNLNAEINATGGYWYIVPGQGVRTYDTEVSDPAVGSEASKVVEIRGGSIRIADSKTAQGEWDWRTVFVSGHIAADLVTAAQIVTGHIGAAESGNYWDLDTGELVLRSRYSRQGVKRSDTHVGRILTVSADDANYLVGSHLGFSTDTTDLYGLICSASHAISDQWYDDGYVAILPFDRYDGESYTTGWSNAIISSGRLNIVSGVERGQRQRIATYTPSLTGDSSGLAIEVGDLGFGVYDGQRESGEGNAILRLYPSSRTTNVRNLSVSGETTFSSTTSDTDPGDGEPTTVKGTLLARRRVTIDLAPNLLVQRGPALEVTLGRVNFGTSQTSNVTVNGTLTVSSTKSRKVSTDNYGSRLLYCYEMPSPYFGDIGSGTIGEDGLCYVEIDDIFAEATRTDMGYQVFLQGCGQGDLWVAEKRPGYFVVEGTPGLAFDWETKGHQTGYETERMEEDDQLNAMSDEMKYGQYAETAYNDLDDYVSGIERTYQDEATE